MPTGGVGEEVVSLGGVGLVGLVECVEIAGGGGVEGVHPTALHLLQTTHTRCL